jgi:hypothetical protein
MATQFYIIIQQSTCSKYNAECLFSNLKNYLSNLHSIHFPTLLPSVNSTLPETQTYTARETEEIFSDLPYKCNTPDYQIFVLRIYTSNI